jgi:hypothetical protein
VALDGVELLVGEAAGLVNDLARREVGENSTSRARGWRIQSAAPTFAAAIESTTASSTPPSSSATEPDGARKPTTQAGIPVTSAVAPTTYGHGRTDAPPHMWGGVG